MRDMRNAPMMHTPLGDRIDYKKWSEDDPPLNLKTNMVRDIRKESDPHGRIQGADLSAEYRADMQTLALKELPTIPFHEWLDTIL